MSAPGLVLWGPEEPEVGFQGLRGERFREERSNGDFCPPRVPVLDPTVGRGTLLKFTEDRA